MFNQQSTNTDSSCTNTLTKLVVKFSIFTLTVLLISIIATVLLPKKASAATLNVVAGNDAIDDNNQCQLSEAIQNINNQAQTNDDCIAGDGNNDTISLPAGTITLTGNITVISSSVTIQGQGMGQTVIDGVQSARGFVSVSSLLNITIRDLTIKDYEDFAIQLFNSNTVLSGIEITGAPVSSGEALGISLRNNINSQGITAVLSNINIHDMDIDASDIAHIIAVSNSADDTNYNVNIQDVTISNIENTSGSINTLILGSGFMGGSSTGVYNATISNLTIKNIVGQGTVNGLVGGSMMVEGAGNSTSDYDVSNITIVGIRSQTSMYGAGTSIVNSTAAVYPGAIATSDMQISNSILSDNLNLNSSVGCVAIDYGPFFGTPLGQSSPSITSSGGNITDNASCNDYFTDPTDQTEVNPADLHLGTLGNHGGSIPTIPLEEGSIAIDSGVTVPSLTTDARGIARPQCSAYDSGAYEYNGNECPEPTPPNNNGGNDNGNNEGNNNSTSNTANLTTPSSPISAFSLRPVSISTPTGTNISSSSTVPESSLVTQDPNNQYPLGLVNFSFTTNQSSNQVVLTFITNLTPNQVTPRKYNPSTNTYTNLPTSSNPTITETTINNQHALVLTYTLIDNGELDLDPTIGTIKDPVGLAVSNTTYDQLANTGQTNTIIYLTLASSLIVIASGLGVIGRRRKTVFRAFSGSL